MMHGARQESVKSLSQCKPLKNPSPNDDKVGKFIDEESAFAQSRLCSQAHLQSQDKRKNTVSLASLATLRSNPTEILRATELLNKSQNSYEDFFTNT